MNNFFAKFNTVSANTKSAMTAVIESPYHDELLEETDKEYLTVTLIQETSVAWLGDYEPHQINGVETSLQLKECILQGRIHHVFNYKGELIDTVLDQQVGEGYIVGSVLK